MPQAVDDFDSIGAAFYRAALKSLQAGGVPFLVGGAYALEVHTGIVRRTKDFDIFVLKQDVTRTLNVLRDAGYQTELTFPHWIAKAFAGEDYLDIIFSSGNGLCPVDQGWFDHAATSRVLGIDLGICPAEETIWQKAFILERDRCDVADVAHLIRHCGERLDWQRLLQRFDRRWRVLLAHLVLFDFIYPSHRTAIPAAVRKELFQRVELEDERSDDTAQECHGTLLSATQYLHAVDREGYRDVRLQPLGAMTKEDLALWTANFMQPK
jgi:hypothetical protein